MKGSKTALGGGNNKVARSHACSIYWSVTHAVTKWQGVLQPAFPAQSRRCSCDMRVYYIVFSNFGDQCEYVCTGECADTRMCRSRSYTIFTQPESKRDETYGEGND